MLHPRYGCGVVGTQDDITVYAGYARAITYKDTHTYNGVSWADSGHDTINLRYGFGNNGTPSSCLLTGGNIPNSYPVTTEEYNGSAWSAGPNAVRARWEPGNCGSLSDAISCGGFQSTPWDISDCERYNGTSWSDETNMNYERYRFKPAGTASTAFRVGGDYGNFSNYYYTIKDCELFNDVSWSIEPSTNIHGFTCTAVGSYYSCLKIGGGNSCEEFNGTSWYQVNNQSVSTVYGQGSGTGFDDSFVVGGNTFATDSRMEYYELASSGTWTVDYNAGASVPWNTIQWTNGGGGSIKVRARSASTQVDLASATWYPIGSFYTSSGADIDAPDNQWLQLEFTLEDTTASVPRLQDATQEYNVYTTSVVADGKIDIQGLSTTELFADGKIDIGSLLPAELYVDGRISISGELPSELNADGRITISVIHDVVHDLSSEIKPSLFARESEIKNVLGKSKIKTELIRQSKIKDEEAS
jgi:hypothetical protein